MSINTNNTTNSFGLCLTCNNANNFLTSFLSSNPQLLPAPLSNLITNQALMSNSTFRPTGSCCQLSVLSPNAVQSINGSMVSQTTFNQNHLLNTLASTNNPLLNALASTNNPILNNIRSQLATTGINANRAINSNMPILNQTIGVSNPPSQFLTFVPNRSLRVFCRDGCCHKCHHHHH